MSFPQYFEFYRDVLDAISDGQVYSISEIRNVISTKRQFSQDILDELLSSGRKTVFADRVNWACTYLFKAGLIKRPQRGKYQLTNEGKQVQESTEIMLDNHYLLNYPSFAEFVKKTPSSTISTPVQSLSEPPASTPQETIDVAYHQLNASLADDLMQEVQNQTSAFFEKLVVQLLLKMGYGGPFEDAGIVTQSTNDGGIDGIIKEDKLGFNQIYIQAKRWTNTVTRPELQKFAGALLDKSVNKGLFITTSQFSQTARDYAERQHIVLIDGDMLTKLMIEYNLGVSTYKTYELKSLDTDFFNNLE